MPQFFKLLEAEHPASAPASSKYESSEACENKVKVELPEESGVEVPLAIERVNTVPSDDCWYLRAEVEGLLMEWLMDCGGNPNLLSVKMFNRIPESCRPKLEPCGSRLIAANGENVVVYGQTVINLNLEGAIFSVPVTIVDITEISGILGMRFMIATDCSIAFKKGVMRCRQQEWKLVGPSTAGCMRVQLIREIRLPPGQGILAKTFVHCVLKNPELGCNPRTKPRSKPWR